MGLTSELRPSKGGMVLEVGAHTRQVLDYRDTQALEVFARPDAAELEDLGSVDRAGSEDNLLSCRDRHHLRRIVSAERLDAVAREFSVWTLAT